MVEECPKHKSDRVLQTGLLIALCLVSLVVYANSFPGSFIGDDFIIVRDNPLVQSANLKDIFTTDYWGTGGNSGLYRPVTILSFALERVFWGVNPLGPHLVNVLLHTGVALLLYLLLHAMGIGTLPAWISAALFAVHPIHTEVVNEAVGRSELLVALFFFLGLLAAIRRFKGFQIVVVVSYGLALLSKEHAITFLMALLLLDLYRLKKPREVVHQGLALYVVLLVMTAGWLLLRRQIFLNTGIPVAVIFSADNPLLGLDVPYRVISALKVQILYLAKLLLPISLKGIYSGGSFTPVTSLLSPWAGGAVLCAASVAVLLYRGVKAQSHWVIGAALYIVTFSVTSNIFFTIAVLFAERFVYLPSAGFCVVIGCLIATLKNRFPAAGTKAVAAALTAALLFMGTLTVLRNPYFADPLTLWQSTVEADADNARAWHFLALTHESAGRYEAAEAAYRRAISSDASYPPPYALLGALLIAQGHPEEGLKMGLDGAAIYPDRSSTDDLVVALAYVELGRPRQALDWLDRTGKTFTDRPGYWEIRGRALDQLGDSRGGLAALLQVPESSRSAGLVFHTARLLVKNGQQLKAEKMLRSLLHTAPSPQAYNLLGVSLVLQERKSEAAEMFRRAMELDPGNAQYRENFSRAKGSQGKS